MAERRDIRTLDRNDGLERVNTPVGYVLAEDQRVEDVLAADATLLRSEGIDPTWLGFDRPDSD